MRRLTSLALVAALGAVACAPDPLDTYSASDDVSTTLGALPTTVAPGSGPVETFPANGTTIDIRSLDNSFVPQTFEVEAGTEIRWINGGQNDHNVLPVDDALDWGVERDEFAPGDAYSRVFAEPGVFAYYCSIHGTKEAGMVGALVVTAPS